jgi:hypothetical protein
MNKVIALSCFLLTSSSIGQVLIQPSFNFEINFVPVISAKKAETVTQLSVVRKNIQFASTVIRNCSTSNCRSFNPQQMINEAKNLRVATAKSQNITISHSDTMHSIVLRGITNMDGYELFVSVIKMDKTPKMTGIYSYPIRSYAKIDGKLGPFYQLNLCQVLVGSDLELDTSTVSSIGNPSAKLRRDTAIICP